MSAIFGIVNFDGAPVEREQLQKMAQAASHLGPDGRRFWIEDNVGLAHLAFHTTPQARKEQQPIANDRQTLWLTADARIDNRQELIGRLKHKADLASDPTDTDLILAAYEAWGEACPRMIIGDFAFAIWDRENRTLFCARDPFGLRPLFYYRHQQTLYFSSTISSIVATVPYSLSDNDLFIVDFLCWKFGRWKTETVYENLLRVPIAHSLTVTAQTLSLKRYWDFGEEPALAYKRDSEYVEHFLELFTQAIEARLQTIGPVGILLSGGVDSSSLACHAHHLFSQSLRKEPRVRLYSIFYSQRFPSSDERNYQNSVHKKCHLFPSSIIDESRMLKGVRERQLYLDEPLPSYLIHSVVEMCREAAKDGCRVVFSGEGADQIMSTGTYSIHPFFLDQQVSNWKNEFQIRWNRWRWDFIRGIISQGLIKPMIPHIIPSSIRRRRYINRQIEKAPKGIKAEWIQKAAEAAFVEQPDIELGFRNHSLRAMRHTLSSGWHEAIVQSWRNMAISGGTELSLPYMDRRLVDFQFLLPARLRFANGYSKIILRKAMVDILPEDIRSRNNKSGLTEISQQVLYETATEEVQAFFESACSRLSRYLNQEELRLAWKTYWQERSLSRPIMTPVFFEVWRSFSLAEEELPTLKPLK